MEANAVLRGRLFELRDRLKADSRINTGRSQRICSDEAISEMASVLPRKISDFGLIQGLGKMFIRNYAQEFLAVLNDNAAESEDNESVRMRGEVECTLQELEKKLVNISRSNRLLFMPRATNPKEAFDLVQISHLCDPLEVLRDRTKRVKLAGTDSKTPEGRKSDYFAKLSQLYRNINRIAREKGRNDLYIGYPFVEGCLPGEAFPVRAPLVLFPVELIRTPEAACLRFDDSRDTVFNNDLILGYFKINGITRPLPDNTLDEIGMDGLQRAVLDFYSAAGLTIDADGPAGIERFASVKAEDFGYPCGELHLRNNIVLGRFPTYSSSIQKDFIDIVDGHMVNPLLDELLSSGRIETEGTASAEISESDLTYINDLNAAQEEVLDAVRRNDRLVIQGPPGTGKSQTITSIIADHVSRGKTVLMVSEKKAALDVVHSRLGPLSKYSVLIDDVNNKGIFYSQMDSISTLDAPVHGQTRDPSDISRDVQDRMDILDCIEDTIYDTEVPGTEPYSLYVTRQKPDPKDRTELRNYKAFGDVFSRRILDYDMPSISEMHDRFKRRSLMTDLEDCLQMRAQHQWMMDLRQDMNDYDVELAMIDLKDLKKEIAQWKNSGFFAKMMNKTRMRARVEEVMSRYWTFYRCSDPALTEYEIDDYIRGLAHYDEFATLNNIYESLSECGKLYLEMMRQAEDGEICSPNLINDKLYDYTVLQHLQRFQSENRAILRDMESFDSIIEEVGMLVSEKETAVRDRIEDSLYADLSAITGSKRFGEFRRAVEMKRRWSINKFVDRFGYELFKGVRIWLLTPDVVSEILPLDPGLFDLVIFDEASQMFVEKGIPSIMRAKKIVIAGDHKQLRPSKLGCGRIGMDEDDAEDDMPACQDSDSLLDVARSKYPSVMLRYHYRSRYGELIEFSNHAFYDGRLCISPNLDPDPEPPISVHKVDGGRWADRCNRPEAERVVDLVSDILRTKGDETVGIITFNSAQMDLIDSMLEDRCSSDPGFKELYRRETGRKENGEDVGLFVRNIENVQGDERDIIVFSIGYAKGDNGKLVRNFGWLNQSGGENRLNVAITRARQKIHIVTSFEPSELQVDDMKNRGPKLLKSYLQYCFAVSSGDRMAAVSVLRSVGTVFAPAKEKATDDRFADSVYSILRSKGLDVVRDVGAGGYGIDIAVRKGGRFVLGIECDGRLYHSAMSTRERDWQRRRYLESRGWHIHRAWCSEWWDDPQAAADRIVSMTT